MLLGAALTFLTGFAPVPVESAKALGVTKGKSFSAGIVFVNGKYVAPPYVVERWGTGIRVNKIPVTGPLIPWEEFLKTQPAGNVTGGGESAAEPPAAEPEKKPEPAAEKKPDVEASEQALADLFGDDPEPPKPAAKPVEEKKPEPVVQEKPKARKPAPALRGKFVKTPAATALVQRINRQRTEIDAKLRSGGFIFFGDGYARVTGDQTMTDVLMKCLPELMKNSSTYLEFVNGLRRGDVVFLGDGITRGLYKNRIDYRALQERRWKIREDRKFQQMLDRVGGPTL